MVTSPSILPSTESVLEKIHEQVDAARRPLPTDLVRSVWNPATCPVDLLPYLAWGFGLEIWDDDWTEAKKRDVVSRIWLLKRRKTTLQGIKDYVELVGSEVIKAIRPRDRVFYSPQISDAERAASMALMPEIRIYPEANVEAASYGKAFYSGTTFRRFYNFDQCLTPSDAETLYADRLRYVDYGVATPITARGLDGITDASIAVELSVTCTVAKAFWGVVSTQACLIPSDAEDHVLAITPDASSASFSIPTGLIPTTVRPEPVADIVPVPVAKAFYNAAYCGVAGTILYPSDADVHVYDSLRLLDPSRLTQRTRAVSFWGSTMARLNGVEPFTAELTVDVPLDRPGWAFGPTWGVGFWNKADMTPLWDACSAAELARAARDELWVSTEIYKPIVFENGLNFGDFSDFGDYRKVA